MHCTKLGFAVCPPAFYRVCVQSWVVWVHEVQSMIDDVMRSRVPGADGKPANHPLRYVFQVEHAEL